MHLVLSVNQLAWKLAEKLLNNQAFYGVHSSKSTAGATIIDAGVNAPGGFQAGKMLTELCLGGAGKAQLGFKTYGEIAFPSITVSTDHPAIATLGSQFAGWRIKEGDNIAIGSGPARALAMKPKDVFEEIGYKDSSDKSVLTLESNNLPSDMLIEKVTTACNIKPENLIVVVAPTASIAGLTQVAGRVVEVGIHKASNSRARSQSNKIRMWLCSNSSARQRLRSGNGKNKRFDSLRRNRILHRRM